MKEVKVLHSSETDMGQTVLIEVCLNNNAEIGVSGEVFAHLFFTTNYNFCISYCA